MDDKLSKKEVLMVKRLIQTWNKTNLMKRIAIGIFVGALLALLLPQASAIGLLG